MRFVRICLVALVFGSGYPAAAEPGRSDPNPMLTEARSAFAEGRSRMAEGRYREAITKFRQAAQVKETPGLRYYIAFCLEQLDELLEARAEYERASELLKDFDAGDVRELLPEARARVDRALASLILDGLASHQSVMIDGNAVDASRSILLNPGRHQVTVRNPDGSSATTEVALGRGEVKRLVPEAPAAVAPPLPPTNEAGSESNPASETPGTAPRSGPWKPVLFWSSVGVATLGAGALVGGLVVREDAAVRANGLLERIDAAPLDDPREPPCSARQPNAPDECDDLASAVDLERSAQHIAIAGGVALGVGATSALLIHYLWPKSQVEVRASVAPGWVGLTLGHSF